jgi:hypothetical protein
MKSESKRPVSIEDLLRLKRAERPAPEFWGEFDRQLRAKQLAALVAKRPWWHSLPRVLPRFSRYHLAFGASAALAVTFVVLRDDTPENISPLGQAPVTRVAATHESSTPTASIVTPVRAENAAPTAVVANSAIDSSDLVAAASARPVEHVLASDATLPGELSQMVALIGGGAATQSDEASPSARHIAANLAVVQSADPVIGRGLLGSVADRVAAAKPSEPLHQIASPVSKRRSHMLTAMVSMASFDSSPNTTERVASQINEEQLYDRVRRLGGRGDRLHIKF